MTPSPLVLPAAGYRDHTGYYIETEEVIGDGSEIWRKGAVWALADWIYDYNNDVYKVGYTAGLNYGLDYEKKQHISISASRSDAYPIRCIQE